MNIWNEVQKLAGDDLFTLSKNRKRKFSIIRIELNHLYIFVSSTGKERKISKGEIEAAGKYLFSRAELTRIEIRDKFSEANPAYVACILAKLPVVKYSNTPVITLFCD